MKTTFTKLAVAAVSSAAIAGSAFAGEAEADRGQQAQLLSAAFAIPPDAEVLTLEANEMQATQGELWPWIIGVTTLDLALASFFWGDYVPAVTGGGRGVCITCGLNKPR